MRPIVCGVMACLLWSASGQAQTTARPAATPQRPTFTSDTSTTAPGTLELETGGTFGEGFAAWPMFLKYTPPAADGFFHQMEFGLAFDALSSVSVGGLRRTEFGDRLGLIVRRPVYRGQAFSLAVAPQATFFLRGEQGARLGATLLAAYAVGLNTLIGNLSWTSATRPSATNPAQQYDVAVDFVRTLGATGEWQRWAVFGGFLVELPAHRAAGFALEQGVSFALRPHWVLDVAVQERGLAAGPRDVQVLVGMTVNLGRPFFR